MKSYIVILLVILLFSGCYRVGYEDFRGSMDIAIGERPSFLKPIKFPNAGELRRGNFLMTGQGFTHITKDENDDLVYHWDSEEILPNFSGNKAWIGKCKYFYVVDPKSLIVKAWGFEKDANPLSCRTWP